MDRDGERQISEIIEGLNAGTISRRQFVLRAGALGLSAGVIGSVLAACGGDEEATTGGGTGTGGGASGATIGLSFPYREISYYAGFKRVTQEEADKAGVEPLYSNANPVVEEQVSELDRWISGKLADAILIASVDDASIVPIVSQAVAADIPIIGWRSEYEGAAGTLSFDNEQGGYDLGKTAAEWANENLNGSPEVALLTFPEQQTTVERIVNAKKGMEENLSGEGTFYEEEALLAADALPVVENLLQAHPDIRVILCTADDACLGARPAYINSGLPRDSVFIAGWDGAPDVLDFIKKDDDLIRATAALPIEELARNAVRVPVEILNGADQPVLKSHPYTIVDGDTPAEEIDRLISIHRG